MRVAACLHRVLSWQKRIIGIIQLCQLACTFHDVPRKNIPQHRGFARARRAVNPHDSSPISQLSQYFINRELLAQC